MQLARNDPPPPEVSRLATTDEIRQRDAEPKVEAKKEPPAPAPEKPRLAEKQPSIEKPADLEKMVEADKQPTPKPPAQKQDPVYQVFMPPLAYDAHAAVQADNFDPKLIVLVRRVRVRPTLIFQGRVEGQPMVQPVAASTTAQKPAAPAPVSPPKDDSVVNRVRAFLRNLFS
jgi:hypothetical protein